MLLILTDVIDLVCVFLESFHFLPLLILHYLSAGLLCGDLVSN